MTDNQLYEQALELSIDLMSRQSVTPNDEGCQDVLIKRLEALGFDCEEMCWEGVRNLWATYTPPNAENAPLLVFAGHTDVVPAGDLDLWSHPPFEPLVQDGWLCGRGAADMKTGIAAMVVAIEDYMRTATAISARLGFLITSDEEGPSIYGTRAVMEALVARGEQIDYCIVGEPSSSQWAGDTIKNGRRGSMSAHVTIHGKQGHVAYPEQVSNPNHLLGQLIAALSEEFWDKGNDYFPPTSFQVTDIKGGVGASNVVPDQAEFRANWRFNTEQTPEAIQHRVQQIADKLIANAEIRAQDRYSIDIDWNISGVPFLTEEGALVRAAQSAVNKATGHTTALSTSGGTSDGRFIAPHGAQVVELGVCNATIHQINERIKTDDLAVIVQIYRQLLEELFT